MSILQRELDEIKERLQEYYSTVVQINEDLELLETDLNLLLGTGGRKFRMEFAVDYDIVHSFAFPTSSREFLSANFHEESLWKKFEQERLFCFFLLKIFKDKLVLLPPHGWELEDKRRLFCCEYDKIREWFRDDNLPSSLLALGDEEGQDEELTEVLDSCMTEGELCESKIGILISFAREKFPDIYTALTFDSDSALSTLNFLLSNRLVTYQSMFDDLEIEWSIVRRHSEDIYKWLDDKRPRVPKSNFRDATSISYLNIINQVLRHRGVLLLLATNTTRLRELTKEIPMSRIRVPGLVRRLPLIRDCSYWSTYLRYFQGIPGEEILDRHYCATLELVQEDRKYILRFLRFWTDIDTYVRDQAGQLQYEKIESVKETLDIVNGIIAAFERRDKLQLAFSHQWGMKEGRMLLNEINGTIARRAKAMMLVLKQGVVQDALRAEIEKIGHNIAGISLVLSMLWKRYHKRTMVKSSIIRHLLHFRYEELERLKNSFFEDSDEQIRGADSIRLALMRQDSDEFMRHPEIFALTGYLLAKGGDHLLAVHEVNIGLSFAEGDERSKLFLVKAMAQLGSDDLEAAIKSCKEGLRENVGDNSLHIFLAFCLWSAYKRQMLDQSALDEAISLTLAVDTADIPTVSIARSNLAYFYAERGDHDKAHAMIVELKAMNPDTAEWTALYKNAEGFVLLQRAQNVDISVFERIQFAEKAKILLEAAKDESHHPQVRENFEVASKLVGDLKGTCNGKGDRCVQTDANE
jgi:tetratricopeptide (TPR) repeat protein